MTGHLDGAQPQMGVMSQQQADSWCRIPNGSNTSNARNVGQWEWGTGLKPGKLRAADLYQEQLGHPQIFPFHLSQALAEFWSPTLHREWVRENRVETSVSASAERRNERPILKTGKSSKSSHIEFETHHSLVMSGFRHAATKVYNPSVVDRMVANILIPESYKCAILHGKGNYRCD